MPGIISGTLFYYDSGEALDDWAPHTEDEIRAVGTTVAAEEAVVPDYATGAYQILNLPAGAYRVEIDLVGLSLDIREPIAVQDNQVTAHDAWLSYAGHLSGTVLAVPENVPVSGAYIAVAQTRDPYADSGTTESDAAGNFAILNLTAVDYASREETFYEVIAVADHRSCVVRPDIRLTPSGSSFVSLELPRAATLSGTVMDTLGHPVGGLVMASQTSGVASPRVRDVSVQSDGSYPFEPLQAPATYDLEIIGNESVYPTSDSLVVNPGDTSVRHYQLQLRAWIVGQVVESGTEFPLEDAVVSLDDAFDPTGSTLAMTDPLGQYAHYGLNWPATYGITAEKEGYQAGSTTVEVLSDAEYVATTIVLSPL